MTPRPRRTLPTHDATARERSRAGWVLIPLAVISLVFVLVPFVAVPLALAVIVGAAISMRGEVDVARQRYRIAAGLSGLTLLVTLVLGSVLQSV